MSNYYVDHLDTLHDLFGGAVELRGSELLTLNKTYPIVDDVIVLLAPERHPTALRARLRTETRPGDTSDFSELVQYSFGDEWSQYSDILPEHAAEFRSYFDLINLADLREARVCDLGCGIGRSSYHLAPYCRELILVDFSDAIFVARRNLAKVDRALFFMGDITALPFRHDFADLALCLGVLHHLPIAALDAVSLVARSAPTLLVYLYYAFDNRPWYFRALWRRVDACRRVLSRVRNPRARGVIALAAAVMAYRPLVGLGHVLDVWGWGAAVPLFGTYRTKSLWRIQQDAYDRLFTSIEQRVSKRNIVETLSGQFRSVTMSETAPYWHFLCRR